MTRFSRQKILLAMALPGVLWMLIFNYVPMYGVIIAFKEYRIINTIGDAPWVGFMHFRELFHDTDFLLAMKNTLGMSLLKLLVAFPMPIVFALLLNEIRSNGLKRSVQTISYLPHFLSWVVLGGILIPWLSETGFVNEILSKLNPNHNAVPFLGRPQGFWTLAIVSDIWKEMGWGAIIYLAAISGIPNELYEAAVVDGAGRFQKMWHITLPSIAGTVTILLILAISGILNTNFEQMLVLSNPLNNDASNVIDLYVYRTGIRGLRFSYSTAVGLFKAIIALILLLGANRISKKVQGRGVF